MKMVGVLAAVALLVVPAGRSAPPPPLVVCSPLPPAVAASYSRYDDSSWQLALESDCTYQARHRGVEEGGGQYTFGTGDDSSGTFTFFDDRGCRSTGVQDLPTPYDYSVRRGVLLLAPEGGSAADRCVDSIGEGRPQELAGHGGWVKALAGTLRISLKGAKRGSFKTSSVISEKGSFRVLHSRVVKHVKTATLRFTGANGAFTLTEHVRKRKVSWRLVGKGTWSYTRLAGSGKGTAIGTRQSLRGEVSN
jgi:hypothetical protein